MYSLSKMFLPSALQAWSKCATHPPGVQLWRGQSELGEVEEVEVEGSLEWKKRWKEPNFLPLLMSRPKGVRLTRMDWPNEIQWLILNVVQVVGCYIHPMKQFICHWKKKLGFAFFGWRAGRVQICPMIAAQKYSDWSEPKNWVRGDQASHDVINRIICVIRQVISLLTPGAGLYHLCWM